MIILVWKILYIARASIFNIHDKSKFMLINPTFIYPICKHIIIFSNRSSNFTHNHNISNIKSLQSQLTYIKSFYMSSAKSYMLTNMVIVLSPWVYVHNHKVYLISRIRMRQQFKYEATIGWLMYGACFNDEMKISIYTSDINKEGPYQQASTSL